MDNQMTLKPRISEKAYGLSQLNNVYVFQVPLDANKLSIARAVATQFGVTVETVNVMTTKGKTKRTVRKGGRAKMGKRVDMKKAYVTLKEGDSIVVFAAEDDKDKESAPKKKEKK